VVVITLTSWSSVAGAVGLVLALQAPASAVEPALRMSVSTRATLSADGQSALLRVRASCPEGAQLLESFLYVTQDGHSTQWGHVSVPCDGSKHTRVVRVNTLDFTLRPGEARASGYLLTTAGESISPTQRLKLKPTPR